MRRLWATWQGRLAVVLVLALAAYAVCWYRTPPPPSPTLKPVATQGGAPAYQAPQAEALAKAAPKKHAAVRTVRTYRTAELPKSEQDRVPEVAVVAPEEGKPAPPTELADTAVVPPALGPTEVRTYVLPDGNVRTTLEPKPEPFLGLDWRRLELEGRYGLLGAERAGAAARWMPLRVGNFHVGLEQDVSQDRTGKPDARTLAVLRWEPFRGR